ncbi:hypothetical protein FH972_005481 [Carpinus fangiana]|uniref:Uncharacterized protein n=1 Tax=Carpinus fangiana TaxID=176857 RepID=A0A5N6QSA3_9ROSI|nr:hypothetical protein FH972_005481 [Carpinus fangiana]
MARGFQRGLLSSPGRHSLLQVERAFDQNGAMFSTEWVYFLRKEKKLAWVGLVDEKKI